MKPGTGWQNHGWQNHPDSGIEKHHSAINHSVLPRLSLCFLRLFVAKSSCKKSSVVCDVAGEGGSKRNATKTKIKTMKTLIKLTLAIVMFAATFAGQAGTVNGYFRSNGTYVMPHYRTPANSTPYDNLSSRGYPSQQPGYVSPRSYGLDSSWSRPTPLPGYGSYNFQTPRPYTGGYTPTPLYRRSSSFGY